MIKNISFEEFIEILRKWSERMGSKVDERLKNLFKLSEEGIEDARKWFEIAKESEDILIIGKDLGLGWAVVEEFWNGGKKLSIEVLHGENKEVIKDILDEILEFAKKKKVRLIETRYIPIEDEELRKILKEKGFIEAFVDFYLKL